MTVLKNKICRFLMLCGMALFLWGSGTEQVYAAGERAYFGSESYEWESGVETMIGIYVTADQTLNNVDYIISYDPDALRHTSEEEETEEGTIRIHGEDLGGTEYRRLIYFLPLRGGDTQITVTEIQVSDLSGNVETAEPITTTIHVPVAESCQLESITLNGESISGFSGDVTEYTVTVDADVDQVDIVTEPSDREVEISDTVLNEGTNDIQITVRDDDGNSAVYTLHVIRPEAESAANMDSSDTTSESEEETQDNTEEQSVSFHLSEYERSVFGVLAWGRNCLRELIFHHTIFSMLIGVLIVVFVILSVMKVRMKRKKKRKDQPVAWSEAENRDSDSGTGENDEETVISIRNVNMDFKRDKEDSGSIKELVIRVLKRQRKIEYFRALDNISFDVKKGEIVGIIGSNGSGKSTILKIVSGVLTPTKGKVIVDKNRIQLLTLGTGFDRELTGKENVYLNGALIGYSREYIDERYDDIVSFAELEGFMDERVKNYSSGMVSRLGFAIATARSAPEILILDEVLSVGDIFFRRKSEKRIQEMIHGGSTVLIVSHSTAVIRNNCTKVVWIEKGKLQAVGDPVKVCEAYERMNQ